MASKPIRTALTFFLTPLRQGDDGNSSKPKVLLPFRCGMCSVSFTSFSTNKELLVHIQAHFVNKPYQCGFCSVSYESNTDLLSHVKKHTIFYCAPNRSNPTLSHTESDSAFLGVSLSDSVVKRTEDNCAVNDGDCAGSNDDCFGDDVKCQADDQLKLKEYDAHPLVHAASVSVKEEIQENQDHPGEIAARESGLPQSLCPTRSPHHLTANKAETYDQSAVKRTEDNCAVNDDDCDDGTGGNDKCFGDDVKCTCSQADDQFKEYDFHPSVHDASVSVKEEIQENQDHPGEIAARESGLPQSCPTRNPHQLTLTANKSETYGPTDPIVNSITVKSEDTIHSNCQTISDRQSEDQCPEHDSGSQQKNTRNGGIVDANKAPGSSSTGIFASSKLFVCPVCPQQNENRTQLNEHLHSMHSADGRFPCPVCAKSLKTVDLLKRHYKVCHVEIDLRPHHCQECGKKFKMQHHLKDHLQAMHGVEQVRPSGTVSDNSTPASSTVGVSECNKAKVFDCPVCPQQNESRAQLKDHLHSMHSADGRFRCPLCKKTFPYSVPHIRMKNHHRRCLLQAELKPHQRPECGSRFKSQFQLDDHPQALHGPGDTQVIPSCHVCKKTFKDQWCLTRHNDECHGQAQAVKGKLHDHVASHSDARPYNYKCGFCDKSLESKGHLNGHLKTHTKEKSSMCEVCGKSFSWKSALSKHRKTHTNAKPCRCNICHREFNSHPGLWAHIRRRHTRERPYQCELCWRSFHSCGSYKRHALTHTDQRPWSCDKCNKTYRSRSSLYYHNAKFHSMK